MKCFHILRRVLTGLSYNKNALKLKIKNSRFDLFGDRFFGLMQVHELFKLVRVISFHILGNSSFHMHDIETLGVHIIHLRTFQSLYRIAERQGVG